jgi:hypothetical protein
MAANTFKVKVGISDVPVHENDAGEIRKLAQIIEKKSGYVMFYHKSSCHMLDIPVSDIYDALKCKVTNGVMYVTLNSEVELDITPKLKRELKKAIKETGDSSFYFYMIGSNDVLLTPDDDVDKGGLDDVAI